MDDKVAAVRSELEQGGIDEDQVRLKGKQHFASSGCFDENVLHHFELSQSGSFRRESTFPSMTGQVYFAGSLGRCCVHLPLLASPQLKCAQGHKAPPCLSEMEEEL